MPLIGSFGSAASKGFGQTRGGPGPYDIEYMVCAGGAGGGATSGGSGGAGGLQVFSSVTVDPGTPYAVTIGGGGAANAPYYGSGTSGSPSSFGPQSSTGGGYGGFAWGRDGAPGGSGGSATIHGGTAGSGISGQGNPGGAGGGGGKGGSGGYTAGGAAYPYSIDGNSYAAGGTYNDSTGVPASANTGGGGGGKGQNGIGGTGGSGIVVVSYAGSERATGGTITSQGGNTIHTFTSPGEFVS